jgi:hypothetical protein
MAGHLSGTTPVLLPADYVVGMDQQMHDLEGPKLSYLRGEWKRGGWWYYYVYGLLIKEPLGTWVMLAGSTAWGLGCAFRKSWNFHDPRGQRQFCFLLFLTIPLAILVSASSYTGMNHHVRYVLPALPYAFIGASGLVSTGRRLKRARWSLAVICACWVASSSLLAYPHSLAYLNELGGGRSGVVFQLNNSNTDWGQDLLLAADWVGKNLADRKLHFAYYGPVPPRFAGLEYAIPPMQTSTNLSEPQEIIENLEPGIYLASVSLVQGRPYSINTYDLDVIQTGHNAFAYFQQMPSIGMIGRSILIYEVTEPQTNSPES